jgi:SAM-dependent methyltransferase
MVGDATGMSQPTTDAFPLRLDNPNARATVRSWLIEAQFGEANVCRALGVEEMSDFHSVTPETADRDADGPLLPLLIRLFLFSLPVPRTAVEEIIGPEVLAAFAALGLLRLGDFTVGQERGEWWYAPVMLYPVGGFLIASDRHDSPDGSPFVPPADIVFPAIFAGTLRFLRLLPSGPIEAALDLCSGSGIAAMVLGRTAGRAVAADITARATHFAHFNRLLNDCRNVEVAQGDLYTPVAGETFDWIVAHPPYVPALDDTMIYRDGGATGESIVRGCVEGLPGHLRPGGIFLALCAGWDTDAGAFEERARGWLGEARDEFDMLFAVGNEKSPRDFVNEWAAHRDEAARGEIGRWDAVFDRIGARSQVYGALAMRRRLVTPDTGSTARPARTARYVLSAATDAACFAWMFRWRDWTAEKRAAAALSGAIGDLRLRLPATMRVVVTHAVTDGILAPSRFVVESSRPFLATTRVDAWMAALLNRFDGERPARAVYEREHAAGLLPDSFGPDDFADLIERFIERGYLEIVGSLDIP